MSQEKVEKYREEKKSRKQEIQKQKIADRRRKMIGWAIAIIIVIALVAGIVITFLNAAKEKNAGQKEKYSTETFLLQDYAGIQEEETGE